MKILMTILIPIIFYSCSIIPQRLNYVGDTYDPVSVTDLYYDEKDIEVDYYTIGRLVQCADPSEFQNVKEKMHAKAKTIGAHGLIININRESGVDTSGDVQVANILEGKLIRYRD